MSEVPWCKECVVQAHLEVATVRHDLLHIIAYKTFVLNVNGRFWNFLALCDVSSLWNKLRTNAVVPPVKHRRKHHASLIKGEEHTRRIILTTNMYQSTSSKIRESQRHPSRFMSFYGWLWKWVCHIATLVAKGRAMRRGQWPCELTRKNRDTLIQAVFHWSIDFHTEKLTAILYVIMIMLYRQFLLSTSAIICDQCCSPHQGDTSGTTRPDEDCSYLCLFLYNAQCTLITL